MKWSHSAHHTVRRCNRQYAFGYLVASSKARDPERREAFILKQLQTVPLWQGQLVHKVLSTNFLADLRAGRPLNASALTTAAIELARRQYAFSASKRYRDQVLTKRAAGDEYCALVEHERDLEIPAETLAEVNSNIARCFDNLAKQQALLDELYAGSGHEAELRLQFSLDGTTVQAHPDLVFVNANGRLVIIDWKVARSETSDYTFQLLTYALAATRCGRWLGLTADDIILKEVNLLTDEIKHHAVSAERLDDAEDYVFRSILALQALVGIRHHQEVDLDEMDVANNPNTCRYCNFAPLCMRRLEAADQQHESPVIQGRLW